MIHHDAVNISASMHKKKNPFLKNVIKLAYNYSLHNLCRFILNKVQ